MRSPWNQELACVGGEVPRLQFGSIRTGVRTCLWCCDEIIWDGCIVGMKEGTVKQIFKGYEGKKADSCNDKQIA
jgi:hypothetical protein